MLKIVVRFIRKKALASQRVFVIITTLLDYWRFFTSLSGAIDPVDINPEFFRIRKELRKNGICVIENFWDSAACAEARAEIEQMITQHPEWVHPSPQADFRIFGAEYQSDIIARFSTHSLLRNIASSYNSIPTRTAFTMAAKMPAIPGNLGSGEGWHRDAFFRQFKSIIYLSDVSELNGPFQLVKDSHKLWTILNDIWNGRFGYMQNRIRDKQLDALLRKDPSRLKTYTAKAGTLILVDTSSIHRGMPMKEGVRYALTNYFFPEQRINKDLYRQFAPIAGIIDVNNKFVGDN